MKKKFRNVSGTLYFFNEINRKALSEIDKVQHFTEEEIDKCPLLASLIQKGVFVEVREEEINYSNNIKKDNDIQNTESTLSVPIGNPTSPVSVRPEGMSRINDYVEPPVTPDLAIDPSKMSRFADTMESLGKVNNFNQENDIKKKIDLNYQYFEDVNKKQESTAEFGNSIKKKDISNLEIWWCGPANDAGGYGRMNRECVEGLFRKGVKVHLDLFKIPDFRSAVPITESMDTMIKTEVSDRSPSVWAVMPQKFLPRSGRKIIFSMIETSEVQDNFLTKCKMANELWLPSKANIEAFQKKDTEGIEIVHMPLGVDVDHYRPMSLTDEQKSIFNITTKGFVFLSIFGWSLRKGVDVLMKSYLKTFTGNDDVSLVIASRKDGSTSVEKIKEIRDEIRKYIKDWCPTPENPPHIVHIGDCLSEESLPVLYNMSNCFVLPSRGEGWCLPACEAGACEIPVVATRCGGQLDFLTDENSYLIDIEGYSIAKQEIRCLSSYYENCPFAVLGEKATSQLQEYMKYIYENYDEAKEKAIVLRKDLERDFTWGHLVNRIYDRIKSF
jgi:glycosyltransferase involved in cell wall biosynthesis